jgi:hypothetical protein
MKMNLLLMAKKNTKSLTVHEGFLDICIFLAFAYC